MANSNEYGQIYDKEISNDEYEVINKFLTLYKNQSIIVADQYREDFNIPILENKNVILNTNKDTWKGMYFCKKVYHKRKNYIIELKLCHPSHNEKLAKYLEIDELRIITNGKIHIINLNLDNTLQKEIIFNIINIFEESKITSPEQAYCNKIYTSKELQKFLTNHEWKNIDKGIQQMPSLANSLFNVREEYNNTSSHYIVDFATILYQLIDFRIHNLGSLIKDEKDLYELDKLILKLSKTELLKIQLNDQIIINNSRPTQSILLDYNHLNRIHKSTQYNVDNTELSTENGILKKLVKNNK